MSGDFAPFNEQRMKHLLGHPTPETAGVPIIFCRHGPRSRAKRSRQSCPEHYCVEMAGVIGEINTRARGGFTTLPPGTGPAKRAENRSNQRAHGDSNSRMIRCVRRKIVIRHPTTMMPGAHAIVGKATFTHPRTADVTQANVIMAIRWGFAMGPQNCCEVPAEAPNARTYAVMTARTAEAQPSQGINPAPISEYPAPIKMNASAKRSGSSLKISPDFVLNPPSIATIPSNKLQSSRN